jgi:hypothetical protein
MDSAGSQPRMLVSDTSGNLYYRNVSAGGSASGVGDGLGQTSSGISLGDSIPGPGPHSFNSNRYQYLNGFMYSIGGSVFDPVSRPAFRVYNNGDFTAGTTMDSTVNGVGTRGLRYNATSGILQLGGTDHLPHVSNSSSGILINNDVPNQLKGRMTMSYIAGDGNVIDSNSASYIGMLIGESNHIGGSVGLDQSLVYGFGNNISAGMAYSTVSGVGNSISVPGSTILHVNGYLNGTADTANGSIIGGSENWFGGNWQLEVGNFLINRSPAGTVLGNGNVDFTTLPYTGTRGVQVPNIANYPLLALGNSNSNVGVVRSNALTVLYNGRTQINTTGHTAALTQDAATPKAALDVVSTNTGVLLPRLTTAQRNAIVSGDLQNGLLLYNTDSSAFQYYNGSAWNSVGNGSSGASGRWQYASGIQYDTLNSVGIGTTNTQGYKLAVKGSALFTKVKVIAPGAWPDYVFKKNYQLTDLAQLEQYITEHHHLPEIASEDDVRKNGIDLGDHAGAVLKKVEELTLYLINENKQLKDQNARLEAQQKEIDELKALILEKNKQH